MATVDLDLIRLNLIFRLLDDEARAPAFRIEALYRQVFQNEAMRGRPLSLSAASAWDSVSLVRGVRLVQEIVASYVRAFHDPHSIPVTHYKRQKLTAIHLDGLFGPVLREGVIRSGREKLVEVTGLPARDAFLDEPILFLKQEARKKGFPKTKKGGGVSLRALKERFEMKLAAKGYSLEAEKSQGGKPDGPASPTSGHYLR